MWSCSFHLACRYWSNRLCYGLQSVSAHKLSLPPSFEWKQEKWEFSCTKWSKLMTFRGSCPLKSSCPLPPPHFDVSTVFNGCCSQLLMYNGWNLNSQYFTQCMTVRPLFPMHINLKVENPAPNIPCTAQWNSSQCIPRNAILSNTAIWLKCRNRNYTNFGKCV